MTSMNSDEVHVRKQIGLVDLSEEQTLCMNGSADVSCFAIVSHHSVLQRMLILN